LSSRIGQVTTGQMYIGPLFIWTGYGIALGIQLARQTGIVLSALLAILNGGAVVLGIMNPFALPYSVVGALVMTWSAFYLFALGKQWQRVEASEPSPELQPPPASDQEEAGR
jgi:hypothetical protein